MFEEMFQDEADKVQSPTTVTCEGPRWGDEEDEEASRLRRGTYIDLTSGREVHAFVGKDRHFFDTKIEYEGIKLPIRVPLTVNAEEVGDVSFQLEVAVHT